MLVAVYHSAGSHINWSAAAAAKSLQSCPTLCDPMDCSLPGSSVHGIFQARVLEWGAIAFSLNWPSSLLFFEVEDIFFSLSHLFCYFIFIWRIIALQYCVGFCCTTTSISHTYTYTLLSWASLPTPASHPSTESLSSRLSQSTRLGPSSFPLALCSYMIMYIFQCCSLSSHHPLLPSVSTSSFSYVLR